MVKSAQNVVALTVLLLIAGCVGCTPKEEVVTAPSPPTTPVNAPPASAAPAKAAPATGGAMSETQVQESDAASAKRQLSK